MTRPVRLGILGGAFDPIHLGHVEIALRARAEFDLDRVLLVPAGDPWQKEVGATAEDRVLMCVLGASDAAGLAVSRMEVDRRGPSYTVETLEALRRFYGPEASISLICGADAAANFPTWHRAEELANLADVIVVAREGTELDSLPIGPIWPRWSLLEMPLLPMSSTEVRARAATGSSLEFLVAREVEAYIGARGLYIRRSDGPDDRESPSMRATRRADDREIGGPEARK